MNKVIELFMDQGAMSNTIDPSLYQEYDVKRGLRNEDGTGVLVGLTRIADVVGYKRVDGIKVDDEGSLYYRGIDIKDIVSCHPDQYIFEEVCFLILFGYLPNQSELKQFEEELHACYTLPEGFVQSHILMQPSKNLMNKLQQDVLTLYDYDDDPDNNDPYLTMEKGMNLIGRMPSLSIYNYYAKIHQYDNKSLIIHPSDPSLHFAQNILSMLRPNRKYSENEAKVLDKMLVLHMDHGGGNNSTFTNVVISSTGTDLYSAYAGSIGSLKGPRHGGANLLVRRMMHAVIEEIGLNASDEKIREIVERILDKDFYDHSGLVYGMGHAIYTLSDPRAVIMVEQCRILAAEKDRMNEFDFYNRFEDIATTVLKERKGINVCANIDFYSGFAYDMLGIPEDLYTLLFVVARSVGWLAHNVENKLYCNRIIRPATKYVGTNQDYVDMKDRKK